MVVDRYGVASTHFSKQVQDKNLSTAAVSKSASSGHPTTDAEDTTSFTSATGSVEALSRAALQTSPTRQAKVEALRQAVKSAQYQLDSAKITESLVNSDI